MNPSKYYKTWYLQGFTQIQTDFPPPFDVMQDYGDVRAVQAMFNQDQSAEVRIAGAQGIRTGGVLLTGIDEKLISGDVLRSEELGVFVRIVGDPKKPPPQARAQLKTFDAYVSDRSTEEAAARQLRGLAIDPHDAGGI